MRRVTVRARRAKQIFQTEGLFPLLRRGFAFLIGYFVQYASYCLYEYTMRERDEADFMPKIQNFTFRIVSTHQEADELVANGFDDFRSIIKDASRSLDRGAIAFCVFVGRELAHIGWVAMTEKAKNTFDAVPYRVDFSNKQACTGGTWTNPKNRGTGLMVYGYFKRFQYLRARGIIVSRNTVDARNIISQRGHAKFGPKMYAKGRYLKILWWTFWKETLLVETGQHD